MSKKKQGKQQEQNSKYLFVVWGCGEDVAGNRYEYFEKDDTWEDALESLQHEISDNVVGPLLKNPFTTFEIIKHNPHIWTVDTCIPGQSIGLSEDLIGCVSYWTCIHEYPADLEGGPVLVSMTTVPEEYNTSELNQKIEEIQKNKDFGITVISDELLDYEPEDQDDAGDTLDLLRKIKFKFLILFCNTYENVSKMVAFLREYVNTTEEELRNIAPDYFEWLKNKETQENENNI